MNFTDENMSAAGLIFPLNPHSLCNTDNDNLTGTAANVLAACVVSSAKNRQRWLTG